jgi:hypothetical protein
MSTNENPGGENGNAGSESDQNQKKDIVSYETHRKLLDEKKRVQEEKRNLEEKLRGYEEDKAKREKEELEKQGNFQKLLEQERAERQKLETEHSGLVESIYAARKRSAVLKHISGKVPDEVVDVLLNVSGVAMNEDGTIVEDTAKMVAQEFEKKHPYLVLRDKQNGGLPSGAASPNGSSKITHAEWMALGDSKKMKERFKDVDWSTAK